MSASDYERMEDSFISGDATPRRFVKQVMKLDSKTNAGNFF